ncbi:MAG: zinc-dependent peptidase, partial [Gemmatimonadota bacterium]|nr:zinc-dependent peptidase [Gemmatimonadota bacterium]
LLRHPSTLRGWGEVLGTHYDKLKKAKKKNRRTLLRKYGATNPAEFFAVATEAFFEKPYYMKKKQPDLYEELKTFYEHDPASWT